MRALASRPPHHPRVACTQVVPALDPSTPIYATSFVMQLIKKRLSEFSLFDEQRFRTFDMRQPFQAGPFE